MKTEHTSLLYGDWSMNVAAWLLGNLCKGREKGEGGRGGRERGRDSGHWSTGYNTSARYPPSLAFSCPCPDIFFILTDYILLSGEDLSSVINGILYYMV